MKLDTKDIIRWILSVVLLVYVWLGNTIAIKLCITLSIISWETLGLGIRWLKEQKDG